MKYTILAAVLVLGVGLAAVWIIRSGRVGAWSHEDSAPTVEQVRRLSELVVLHVPVADVQVTRLRGYTGGINAVVLVKGDCEVAVDLEAVSFAAIDRERRQAVLVLPAPRPRRPRLDFRRTEVYEIDKTGLWSIVPGGGITPQLVNEAMEYGQRTVLRASQQPELIEQAQQQTEHVLVAFFAALGWEVQVRWQDQPTASTSTQPVTPSPQP